MSDRVASCFSRLSQKNRKALVSFTTAGDPDLATSTALALALAEKSDILEIGMPFSDPMADGNTIQESYLRSLLAGHTMAKTFAIVKAVRAKQKELPIILMGYINPVLSYGNEQFLRDATLSGVDGLVIVDTPPEEDSALCHLAKKHQLHWIRLVTPTTSPERLQKMILPQASGFIYCVSMTGITGTQKPDYSAVEQQIAAVREHSNLPVVVGFGIRDKTTAQPIAQIADGIVVGSAIVEHFADKDCKSSDNLIASAVKITENIKQAL